MYYIKSLYQFTMKCPFSSQTAAFFSSSPSDGTSLQRCRGQLAVWGALPADWCYQQEAPNPSLRAWTQHLPQTGADRICCWSAGWPTRLQTHPRKPSHEQELVCENATDVHMMSNKLRLNDEQHVTCQQRFHAQHYDSHCVNTLILSFHEKCTCLCDSGAEILKAEVVGMSKWCESTRQETISLTASQTSWITIRKDAIFHASGPFQFHFSYENCL